MSYPIAGLGAASDGTPVAKIRRAATNADIVQFTTAPLGARDVSLGAPEIFGPLGGWSSIHEQFMHVPIIGDYKGSHYGMNDHHSCTMF